MKHYSINPDTKVITANIARLTAKELSEVQKYVALGFKIEDGKPEEQPKSKRLNEDYILKYLDKHLTAEEAEKAKAEYTKKCNAAAYDDNGDRKTRIDKKTKKVETITKGFNNGRNLFAKTYPLDIAELDLSDEEKKKIAESYEKYKDKGDKANAKAKEANLRTTEYLNETEYTRYYYWTKIFTK